MLVNLYKTQTKVFKDVMNATPRAITIINYVGGLGSGKTFLGALLTACYIYSYPNSKILMVGPTIPLVKDNTFATMCNFLKILGIEILNTNKEKTMWLTSNNCTVMISHGMTYKQLLTYEFNYIDVEEASKISNGVLKQIQGRARYVNGNAPIILVTHTNPPSTTNHYTLKSGITYIGSSYENESLPDGYIDNLSKNMTAEEKEKFINGKITPALDNALITNYDPLEVKLSSSENLADYKNVFVTCDFNYSPQCWYSGIVTNDERFLFLDEHLNLRSNTESQATAVFEYLLDKYNGLKDIVIYGDAAGAFNQRLDNDYIVMDNVAAKLGLNLEVRVMPTNPRVTQRLSIFRAHIKGDKYKFNLDKMRKTDYVFENTKVDVSTGKIVVPSKQELEIEPDLIYTPHAVDAISYLMYYEEHFRQYKE